MVLEYHKTKDTIALAKSDKEQWVKAAGLKRQQVAEQWIAAQGWTGTVTIDPAELPETEYLVLDPWKDAGEIHDLLVAKKIVPALAERGADDSWMRFTFAEDVDVNAARTLIEG